MDPVADEFAHVSVYNYAENSPIVNIVLWGLQAVNTDGNWQYDDAYGDGSVVEEISEGNWLLTNSAGGYQQKYSDKSDWGLELNILVVIRQALELV